MEVEGALWAGGDASPTSGCGSQGLEHTQHLPCLSAAERTGTVGWMAPVNSQQTPLQAAAAQQDGVEASGQGSSEA